MVNTKTQKMIDQSLTKKGSFNKSSKNKVAIIQKKKAKPIKKIKVGNNYTLKITALSSTNLGLNEFAFGFPVLMGGVQEAKAALGDYVQMKLLKIGKSEQPIQKNIKADPSILQKTNQTYAVGKILKVVSKNPKKRNAIKTSALPIGQKTIIHGNGKAVTIADKMEVTVSKKGPKGTYLARPQAGSGDSGLSKVFIISTGAYPLALGQKVMVNFIRVSALPNQKNYAWAVPVQSLDPNHFDKSQPQSQIGSTTSLTIGSADKTKDGSKITLVLPKKAKRYLKHIVIKVFLRAEPLNTNAKLSLQFFIGQGPIKSEGLAMYQTNLFKGGALKTTLAQNTNGLSSLLGKAQETGQKIPTILFIKPMAGVKLGEKVQIKILKAFHFIGGADNTQKTNILIGQIFEIQPTSSTNKNTIVKTTIKQMLNSGMHYGEKAIKCNARMLKQKYVWMSPAGAKKQVGPLKLANNFQKPLIKKGRNIINLFKTRRCLNKALAQLAKYAAKGKTFLFVGTKKAASGLIARASLFSKKAFFVNTRWLGGMLTNWKTIVKSISKIRPILKEKQLIIKDILQKRQSIKTLLMEKAFLLKNKSHFAIARGRQLLQKMKTSNNSINATIFEKTQKLTFKRKEFVQKGQVLLEKRQLLLQKRKQVISQSQALYTKFISLTKNSKEYLNRATSLRKRLRELKSLLFVSQQLQLLQQTANKTNLTKDFYTVSYDQYKQILTNYTNVLPNPPKEILNKMVLFIKQNKPSVLETSNISKKEDSSKSSKKVYLLTQLLSQLSSFAPSIKNSMKLLITNLKKIQAKLRLLQTTLKGVVTKMESYFQFKNHILLQLRQIQQTLTSQRNIIRVVKRKIKQISAQKRFIQFLPNLRHLNTSSTQIALTVQVLMKNIVDPKLKYPMDSIYDQKLISQSKKVASMRKKKWQRLEKYLGGISNMTSINTKQIRNNVAIIVGQQEEMNAVRECKKLGIQMFHIVDTNCNPGLADHFIPANDDSRNSIQYILTQFLTRIRLAQKLKTRF